jgi:hypothetical protein
VKVAFLARSLKVLMGETAVDVPGRIFAEKEIRHVRNYLNRCFGFDVAGCFAHMAPQPKMGLLSEWRHWFGPFDSDHSATSRPAVAVRIVCGHMRQKFMQIRTKSGKDSTSVFL